MDNGERQQLELLTERASRRGKEDYDKSEQRLFAEHSAKGMLGSGATIMRAVAIMGETGTATFDRLILECEEVSRTSEAFDLVDKTMAELLDALHQRLPKAIGMGTRGISCDSFTRASEELFA